MTSFESPLAIRIQDTIFAFLEFPLMVVIVILAGALPGGIIGIVTGQWWIGVISGVAVCWFFFPMAWEGFLSRLRFSVEFHSDRLQIGRGLSRYNFSYDSVEKIAAPRSIAAAHNKRMRIMVTCCDEEAKVYLDPGCIDECISLLRETCSNAIYIDEYGQEYLPEIATRPDFTLVVLRKHYRGSMYKWMFSFLISIYGTFGLVVAIINSVNGKLDFVGLHFLSHFAFGPVLMVTSLYKLLNYKKKIKVVSTKIDEMPLHIDMLCQ